MVWFKVDDGLAFHPKVLAAGNAAMGLWVRAGSWSAQQLTNGEIPDSILPSLGTVKQAEALVRAGLWTRGASSWSFHEWNADGRQPTREAIEAERSAARERQRKHREERVSSRRDGDVTNGVTNAEVTGGVTGTPTRPDPTNIRTLVQPAAETYPNDFEAWWLAYPRKESKGDALKAWQSLRKAKKLPAVQVLVAASRSYGERVDDPQFLKLPGGWLRAHKWEDEAPAPVGQAARAVVVTPEQEAWLAARGVMVEEYLERKDEPGWLQSLKVRAHG